MVYFKVTDGVSTRKFKVNPGEITYDQMKERIAALFPKAMEGSQNVHLKYRDSDGDLITVSTNEEFQEAIAELPPEHVWKLHIHGGSRPTPKQQQRQSARATVPSGFFFQPTLSPYGGLLSDPWFGGFGRRSYLSNPWSSLEREFDRMLDEHTEVLNSLHNTGDQQPSEASAKPSEASATAGPAGEGTVQTQSEGGAVASSDGRMKIKNFGSWEPKEFDGPFGKGRIIGPVGYYVSWSSGPEEGEKSSEGKKEEGKKESADAAPQEKVEGMETAQ